MIERVPPEVWLPSGEVLGRYEDKRSILTLTGTIGPIDTDSLRNKLLTAYLSVDHPEELTKPRDATGIIWGSDFNIEQFVAAEEQEAEQRYGVIPDLRPFHLSGDPFTRRELDVLEFLFPDEMLEWRRRDVALQKSVARELDRRTGVFMAALGEGSIKAIGQFFKYTALAGTGLAAAGPVAGRLAGSLGIESLSSASWGAQFIVGTGTGEVIGAGTGALDQAISNAPDLVRGDIDVGDYFGDIAGGAWSGAKGGAVFGAAGEVAGPFVSRLWKWIWPASKPVAPGFKPPVPASKPPVPRAEPNVATPPPDVPAAAPNVATARSGAPPAVEPGVQPNVPAAPLKMPKTRWIATRLREALASIKLGFASAEVAPTMEIGYAKGGRAALVDTPRVPARTAATPAPTTDIPTTSVAGDMATPAPVRPAPSTVQAPAPVGPAPTVRTQLPSAASSSVVSPGPAASLGATTAAIIAPSQASVQSEARQRVAVVERMQSIVDESARIGRDAIATGDRAVLSEFLYPREVALALQGDARFLGIFVEWRSRYMFALNPLVQPHVGRGGYLGERYVIGRSDPRRGFADFFGTPGGLLSNIPIEITTNRALAAHLNRYYLKRGLILTY